MTGLQTISRCACIMIMAMAFGCAQVPEVRTVQTQLFHDSLFGVGRDDYVPDSVFELNPAMRAYLGNEVLADRQSHNATQSLFNALYDRTQLQLEYDSSYTRTAIEAFQAKSGNCLSLVLMTAAFAKELGLKVRYQSVYTPENISRDESTIYYSSHLNLVLGKAGVFDSANDDDNQSMVIDFLTPKDAGGQRALVVSERAVLSMYMNNRAVEEMQEDRLSSAYRWAKRAIVNDPSFLASYNTLGVIYQRHGNLREAEQVLRHVLELDPSYYAAMDNLSHVVLKRGDKAEYERLQRLLKQMVATPPFHYFDLGMVAMKSRDYRSARDYFEQEIRRAGYNAEFHFWLSAAYLGLEDASNARKHLIIARENATTPDERELYSLKLQELQAQHRY